MDSDYTIAMESDDSDVSNYDPSNEVEDEVDDDYEPSEKQIKVKTEKKTQVIVKSDDNDTNSGAVMANVPSGPRDYKRFSELTESSQKERLAKLSSVEKFWPSGALAYLLPTKCRPMMVWNEDGKLVKAKFGDESEIVRLDDAREWPSNILARLLDVARLLPGRSDKAGRYLIMAMEDRQSRGLRTFELGLTGADCKAACRFIKWEKTKRLRKSRLGTGQLNGDGEDEIEEEMEEGIEEEILMGLAKDGEETEVDEEIVNGTIDDPFHDGQPPLLVRSQHIYKFPLATHSPLHQSLGQQIMTSTSLPGSFHYGAGMDRSYHGGSFDISQHPPLLHNYHSMDHPVSSPIAPIAPMGRPKRPVQNLSQPSPAQRMQTARSSGFKPNFPMGKSSKFRTLGEIFDDKFAANLFATAAAHTNPQASRLDQVYDELEETAVRMRILQTKTKLLELERAELMKEMP